VLKDDLSTVDQMALSQQTIFCQTNVYYPKCPSAKNVSRPKCLSAKMSVGQTVFDEMTCNLAAHV
jgi:hypothetical protein